MSDFNSYVSAIDSGEIPAGKALKDQIRRHKRDLKKAEDPEYPFTFDESRADAVIQFAELLKHAKGPLQGELIVLAPFQKFILRMLFGWVRKDDGRRRFKKTYFQIARKSAKTTLMAIIALYIMVTDDPGTEVYSVAPKAEQSRICWDMASTMVNMNPQLSKALRTLREGVKFERKSQPTSVFKFLSSDNRSDGSSPSVTIVDEIHQLKTWDLVESAESGQGARLEPLLLMITTAGRNLKYPGYQEYLRAKKIASGELENEAYLPIIYEIDEKDDWKDPKNWMKAQPGLNICVSSEYMQEQLVQAKQGKAAELNFKTKQMNLWVNEDTDTWIAPNVWQKNTSTQPLFSPGEICFGGVDLSGVHDLTTLSLYFPLDGGGFKAKHRVYVPEATVEERIRLENSHYGEWIQQGFVTPTPGDVTDHSYLIENLIEAAEKYDLQMVGYDPYKSGNIISPIENEGIPMLAVKQGIRHLSEPCRAWEMDVRRGLIQDPNPVMGWCLGNTVVKPDNKDNIIPLKRDGANRNRIDLVISSVIAHHLASTIDTTSSVNPFDLWGAAAEEEGSPINTNLKPNPLDLLAELEG